MPTDTDHADAVERILPEIARRLFTMPPDSPLAELPNAQLKVCALLLDGRRTVSEVADEMRISASGATQVCDRLEKTGLIERVPTDFGAGDRRHRHVVLTAHGRGLMEARRDGRRARVAAMLARLAPEEQEVVRGALETILRSCRDVSSAS